MDGTQPEHEFPVVTHEVAPRVRLPMNHAGFSAEEDGEHAPPYLRSSGYELPRVSHGGRARAQR